MDRKPNKLYTLEWFDSETKAWYIEAHSRDMEYLEKNVFPSLASNAYVWRIATYALEIDKLVAPLAYALSK